MLIIFMLITINMFESTIQVHFTALCINYELNKSEKKVKENKIMFKRSAARQTIRIISHVKYDSTWPKPTYGFIKKKMRNNWTQEKKITKFNWINFTKDDEMKTQKINHLNLFNQSYRQVLFAARRYDMGRTSIRVMN